MSSTEATTKVNKDFRFLTGNSIKIIAVISMFIDHFYKVIMKPMMPEGWLVPVLSQGFSQAQVRFIEKLVNYAFYGMGRIAFPLFCFLLAEGFYYTKSRKRYLALMAVFALLSEIPFDLAFFGEATKVLGTFPFYFGYQNVYFTLFLGLCALWCIDNVKIRSDKPYANAFSVVLKTLCVFALSYAATLICSDYQFKGVLFIAAFYLMRKSRLHQALLFLVVYTLTYRAFPSVFILFSTLILCLYNGERGKRNMKYFFYFFYPVHLLLIYFLSLAMH